MFKLYFRTAKHHPCEFINSNATFKAVMYVYKYYYVKLSGYFLLTQAT